MISIIISNPKQHIKISAYVIRNGCIRLEAMEIGGMTNQTETFLGMNTFKRIESLALHQQKCLKTVSSVNHYLILLIITSTEVYYAYLQLECNIFQLSTFPIHSLALNLEVDLKSTVKFLYLESENKIFILLNKELYFCQDSFLESSSTGKLEFEKFVFTTELGQLLKGNMQQDEELHQFFTVMSPNVINILAIFRGE